MGQSLVGLEDCYTVEMETAQNMGSAQCPLSLQRSSKLPDYKLANEYGCAKIAIRRFRKECGIESYAESLKQPKCQ